MSGEVKQARFEGWAIVEMLGHRKEIGFVTTEAYGAAVLFRVDTPELPEREYTLEQPGYADNRYCPVGTKVKRPSAPASTCLVAPGSLYAMNPCSEKAALVAIERSVARPLIILELPPETDRALPPHSDSEDDREFGQDDSERDDDNEP